MNEKIKKHLEDRFKETRIIFWYDGKQEFTDFFNQLEISQVSKIEINNNEFQVKYRILKEKAKDKFLLYFPYEQKADKDNWLLDVQLAEGIFSADKLGLMLSEFHNNQLMQGILKSREYFLNSDKRRQALKNIVDPADGVADIHLKMLAICANTNADIASILTELIKEYGNDKYSKYNLIVKSSLESELWDFTRRSYGYESKKPSIKDFIAELFDNMWTNSTEDRDSLFITAIAFFNNFKDNRKNRQAFIKLSQDFAKQYSISEKVHKNDINKLEKLDIYQDIDKAIIGYLIDAILHESINQKDLGNIISKRQSSFWYSDYENVYKTIQIGAVFLEKLGLLDLQVDSMADMMTKYMTTYYQIDQDYRQFSYHFKKTNSNSSLLALFEKIERLYSNNFLLDLNNKWQEYFDIEQKTEYIRQGDFYKLAVESKLKTSKLVVIISDAMRYEVGQELLTRITSENRYIGNIQMMLASLPSYTQLGMASLLPHEQLCLDSKSLSNVEVDGRSSLGLDNRNKILQSQVENSIAFNYEDIMSKSGDEIKQLCVDHKLIYIYHNVIDATGDKLVSEAQLPQAVEKTLEQLTGLVKKIGGGNRITNFMITADHGFLYQDSKVDESDFLDIDIKGQDINKNRRFVIGKKLPESPNMMKFTSDQLNIGSGLQILVAKSINKLRVQGSGSRYVHGGASLQELIIPIVRISKPGRKDDVSQVEVDLLQKSNKSITTGQVSVTIYQSQAVTEKIKARFLTLGLYSDQDELISDVHELTFNSNAQLSRERETKVKLILNDKANDYNNQTVYLKLKNKMSDTNKYVDYKSYPYLLKISIFADF